MATQTTKPSHLKSAEDLLGAGRDREATEEFQKAYEAKEIDAQNALAWNAWGVALYRLGKHEEAIAKYKNALQANDRFKEAYYNMGLSFAAQKKHDQAIEHYRKATDIDPNYAIAYFSWGNSLASQKDYDQAIQQYRKATDIDPNYATAYFNWGISLRNQKHYAQAAEQFGRATTADPKYVDAWVQKISALRILGRLDEAESTAREAAEKLPDKTEILQEFAKVYFDRADYRHGLETIDKAINLDRQNKNLWKSKLAGLNKAPDPALVEEAAQEVMREFPADAGMFTEVGSLYRDQGEYEKAKDIYDKAWRFNETTADDGVKAKQSLAILVARGWLYYYWCYIDRAVEEFDRALHIDQNDADALRSKIDSLRQRRRLDEAETLLDRLLADPRHAKETVLLNERGWLRLQRTHYEKAIEAFRATLRIEPSNEDALLGILRAHRLCRDFKAADRAWNEEIIGRGVIQGASLFVERCQCFLDQRKYSAGLEYYQQRPDTDLNALEWKVIFLRFQRQFEAAETEADAALARFPKNVAFLNQLGQVYFAQRRYEKAADCYQQVLDDHPTYEFALRWRAESLRAEGPHHFDAAEREIRATLRRIPESASLHLLLGRLHYDRDQLEKSEECLSRAIALAGPDDLEADFLRIDVLERLDRTDEARQAVVALSKKRPRDLEVRNQLGWFHLGRNDTVSARKEFDFILKIDPKNLAGITGLGAVYFTEGDFKKGEDSFRSVYQMEPNEPVYITNLAWALIRQEEEAKTPPTLLARELPDLKRPVWERRIKGDDKDPFTEAEKLGRDAIALAPRNAQSYTCLGIIAFKRGLMLESEDYLRASIRANAKDGGYVDLGALYVHMGKYDDAETNLKKGIKVARTDSRTHIELGNLYLLTDREKEGIRLFREAADIDPANPEPPRALALALQRKGDYPEAEQVLRKAIQKLDRSRCWQLRLTLAQLLTELGDKSEDVTLYDDALEEIKAAIRLKPLNPEVYFRAGIVWHRLEDYKRAVKHFRECMKLDPDHIEAGRNLRIVRALIREQARRGRSIFWMGVVLGTFCLLGVVAMWYLYFTTKDPLKITSSMIAGLTPTLIAIAAAAFLFPYLVRLKLPGVEADLSQPSEKISKGPVGGIGGK